MVPYSTEYYAAIKKRKLYEDDMEPSTLIVFSNVLPGTTVKPKQNKKAPYVVTEYMVSFYSVVSLYSMCHSEKILLLLTH